jgi:hypothetical protein
MLDMVLWDFNICYFVWNGIFVKFQFVVQTPLHIRWYYGMSVSAISFGMDFLRNFSLWSRHLYFLSRLPSVVVSNSVCYTSNAQNFDIFILEQLTSLRNI